MARTDGALAKTPRVANRPAPRLQLQTAPKAAQPAPASARPAPKFTHAVQGSLFHQTPASNVIPIASYAPGLAETPRPRNAAARRKPVQEQQPSLDFLAPLPAQPRTLSTTVNAVIYCELPVATTLHRAVASVMDWSMVLIGYSVFLTAFRLLGGAFVLTKPNLVVFGGMLALTGFVYGLFFALAGVETPGMRWTQLRLTTFDGFPPEYGTRLIRFAASCLSRCTLLGLLWSLADEESLGWHDHISRTFPTPRSSESEIFRRR